MAARAWRNTKAWKSLCAQVYAEEWYCHICEMAVDTTLGGRYPESRSVDHLIPVSKAPWLALERNNCRLAHYGCNCKRSAAPIYQPQHSRDW